MKCSGQENLDNLNRIYVHDVPMHRLIVMDTGIEGQYIPFPRVHLMKHKFNMTSKVQSWKE
jgi:hypothetical protein